MNAPGDPGIIPKAVTGVRFDFIRSETVGE